jgi:hypothetical protein
MSVARLTAAMGAASMDKSGGSVIAMITSPRRRIFKRHTAADR